MTLRQASPADVPAMATILGNWFAATDFVPRLHTEEEDRWFLNRLLDDADVVVAAEGTVLQGFIARTDTEISQLYVEENARGRGIGGQLLDLMKGRSDHLALWCFQANAGARRFYEHHGFRVTDYTDGRGNEEHTPDMRYEWRRG